MHDFVGNARVSHGSTHRFPAEHHSAELARLMAIPAVAQRTTGPIQLVLDFDVPDLGGYSVDGKKVFIDKDAARKLDAKDIEGIIRHERTEKALIDVLGYSYAAAHEMATTAEHEWVNTWVGNSPAAYEARLKPFIKRSEHEKITNPPFDLDCHPYYEHPDAQDLKILARLAELGVKDAQQPQKKLSHEAAGYGPGHEPEFCKGCKHFVGSRGTEEQHSCHLVVDPISPRGWCRLWAKK